MMEGKPLIGATHHQTEWQLSEIHSASLHVNINASAAVLAAGHRRASFRGEA